MTSLYLQNQFRSIGARMSVMESPVLELAVEVRADALGEHFVLRKNPVHDIENVIVLDVRAADRRLLLCTPADDIDQIWLCAREGRHWTVTRVDPTVADLDAAVAARAAQASPRVGTGGNPSFESRRGRKPLHFRRQGALRFIPAPNLKVSAACIRLNEPIRQGVESRPHVAQFCVRLRGETVYVCDRHPHGLIQASYENLLASDVSARQWNWEVLQREPRVYVKGRVRHPEHKTVTLDGWHRVVRHHESACHSAPVIARSAVR